MSASSSAGLPRIEATYALSSPLFMGGADQNQCVVSAKGFVGALAFWWRALAWERLRHPSAADLRAAETRVFGSAEAGGGIFQIVRIKIDGAKEASHHPGQAYRPAANGRSELPKVSPRPAGYENLFDENNALWRERGSGTNYLCGQGIRAGRACLRSPLAGQPALLTVKLLLKPAADPSDIGALIDALKLLGLVGGVGARSRRALGSLSLQSLFLRQNGADTAYFTPPQTPSEFEETLKPLIPKHADPSAALPPYTAISGLSDWVCVEINNNAAHALNWLGQHYQLFRGYGRGNPHTIGGRQALHRDQNNPAFPHDRIKSDHDWFIATTQPPRNPRAPVDQPIERALWGLPLMFHHGQSGAEINALAGDANGRRASPLFLHLHRLDENCHLALILLLPAVFLPEGMNVEAVATQKNGERTQHSADTRLTCIGNDYSALRAFLNWISTSPYPPGGDPP